MRLIDADAIPWTDLNDNPNSKIRVLITFADKVNKMPTIEERKTGKWLRTDKHDINGNTGWKCSCCGNITACNGVYCHACGAKMREQP